MHYRPRSIAESVNKVARQNVGKDWGLYANLLEHWAEIVGTDYAKVTAPVKITFPYQPKEAQRKNGVLTIKLPKGLAMEFSFKADLIRQRVNMYFGYEAFARIALEAAALPPPPAKKTRKTSADEVKAIQEKASPIENNDLREALERFGETLLQKS